MLSTICRDGALLTKEEEGAVLKLGGLLGASDTGGLKLTEGPLDGCRDGELLGSIDG